MATQMLAHAREQMRLAELNIRHYTGLLENARRMRDQAVDRERRLRDDLARIERSLNLMDLPGRQLLITGNRRQLQARRREILQALTAAPD